MLNYVPRWWPSWILDRQQKHKLSRGPSFTPSNKSIGCVVSGKKIFKNISQSECIIGPGGQVEIPIGTNFTNLVEVTQ
jgi:hypothetical protein